MWSGWWLVWSVSTITTGILILPDIPPRGFNSFDNYHPTDLNDTTVPILAQSLRSQLLPSGFDTLTIDGGWSVSVRQHPNGTKYSHQNLDEYGREIPAPERYSDMKTLANILHGMGLKLGLWVIRGVHIDAVRQRLRVKGTHYTVDELVDINPVGGGKNGSCLWDKDWLGVNRSHPAAQTYYDSRVELLASYGVDFIKADCMMCGPCYTDEIEMFTAAVKKNPRHLVLSYSPGGGNLPVHGKWVAREKLGTMYRVTTDFHGGWYGWGGLQEAIFIAGNFSAANLNGLNGTYPDLDMLPLGPDWWQKGVEQRDRGQTIVTLWCISRSPLMFAGRLPTDSTTLGYVTNPKALALQGGGINPRAVSYSGNCTCVGGQSSCAIPHKHPVGPPCVARWLSTLSSTKDQAPTHGIALINLGENTTSLSSGFADFGLPTDGHTKYRLWDIWRSVEVGVYPASGSFSTSLRPHASVLYEVSVV